MNVSISLPLDIILKSLDSLSLDNRRWLGEHLIEEVKKEEEAKSEVDDEDFFHDFLMLPYDNPMSAAEENEIIRGSHCFDPNRDINHLKYEG